MLGISRQRVQVLISQGRIPAQRLDGSTIWMIESRDLFRFIKKRRSPIE
jgi:Helix-turn-helix domain